MVYVAKVALTKEHCSLLFVNGKKKKKQPKNPLNLQTEVFVSGKFTVINLPQ